MYPAIKANGKQIKTIEDLATQGNLDPMQDSFIAHGAKGLPYCPVSTLTVIRKYVWAKEFVFPLLIHIFYDSGVVVFADVYAAVEARLCGASFERFC